MKLWTICNGKYQVEYTHLPDRKDLIRCFVNCDGTWVLMAGMPIEIVFGLCRYFAEEKIEK